MTENIFDPTQRPGLAYQYAFDWLAVQLHAAAGPTACWVTSVFHGVELLRRLPEITLLEPVPDGLETAVAKLNITRLKTAVPPQNHLTAVAMIEPLRSHTHQFAQLQTLLPRNGRFYVISGGKFGRFLAERRQQPTQTDTLNDREVVSFLTQNGFHLRERIGLHGAAAVAWHYAGRMVTKFGRLDWQDRCHYAMRRSFVIQGRRKFPAALTCLAAERVGA